MEIEWGNLIQSVGPTTALIALTLYCVRAVYTGTWIPRATHERELDQLEKERARWQLSAEKWEVVAEGRLKLILQRQQAVVEVTDHVVKAIRGEVDKPDDGMVEETHS